MWITFHLPFNMAVIIAGASLSKLVLAHDCRDTDVETLWGKYAVNSESKLQEGLRWFYCAGIAIALASMGKWSTFLPFPSLYMFLNN
jgi:hypothetical protein